MQLRHHHPDDSVEIGEILALGWAQAYSGVLPPSVVGPRADVARRRAEIAEFLTEAFDSATEALFVAESDGRVLGFCHAVLGGKDGQGTVGFINLLYVRAEAQGRGVGRRLLARGAEWLGGHGAGPVAIAAFAQNPFAAFYAHVGGRIVLRRTVEIEGATTGSVTYLWPSASALVAAALG